jgi:DNA-binding CsgD family transcriptional regulator
MRSSAIHVCRMYCDPPKWESWVAKWAGRYGEKRVVEWWTNRRKPMAYALSSFIGAIAAGKLSHDGDAQLDEHVANARQLVPPTWWTRRRGPSGFWKERPDSPKKIDAAMAAVLSWEARNDAIAAGEGAGAGAGDLLPEPGQMSDLTQRQAEVAERVARGQSDKAIARDLGLSVETVREHIAEAARRIPGDIRPRSKLALWFFNLNDDAA